MIKLKNETAQEIVYRVSDQTQDFEVVMPNELKGKWKDVALKYFRSYMGRFECISERSGNVFLIDCSEFEDEIAALPAVRIPNTNKDIRCIIGHIDSRLFDDILGLFTLGEKRDGKLVCYACAMVGAWSYPYDSNYNDVYRVDLQKIGINESVVLKFSDIGYNAQTGEPNGKPLWKRRYSEKFEELLQK